MIMSSNGFVFKESTKMLYAGHEGYQLHIFPTTFENNWTNSNSVEIVRQA